jgi:hypothetical protein
MNFEPDSSRLLATRRRRERAYRQGARCRTALLLRRLKPRLQRHPKRPEASELGEEVSYFPAQKSFGLECAQSRVVERKLQGRTDWR